MIGVQEADTKKDPNSSTSDGLGLVSFPEWLEDKAEHKAPILNAHMD